MLDSWLILLQGQPWVLVLIMAVFGLVLGSFLNVVIYRVPIMLKVAWRRDCRAFLELAPEPEKPFNLALPHSHCPHCQHALAWYQNLPLISFLLQRGRCAYCKQGISWRYPLVESMMAVVSAYVASKFGLSWVMLAVLALSAGLIAASFIDLAELFIPDEITYLLLWFGLLMNTQAVFASLPDAVVGAVVGYLILWLVGRVYWWIRQREGMGHGDFKLLALFGAWLGWQALLPIILLASIAGAVVGVILLVMKKAQRTTALPFGPYLAIAGWVVLMWGNSLTQWLHY